jgi:hypothetical protein
MDVENLSPIEKINKAFKDYSVGGFKSASIFGCWEVYINNHKTYLEDKAIIENI